MLTTCDFRILLILTLPGEQQFHEKITPSLKQGVEHITPWTDLPTFELSKDPDVQFTDDCAYMDTLCADILENVGLSPSSQSSLLVVAFAIQLVPGSSSIQTIQLCTPYHNIVFRVRASPLQIFARYLIHKLIDHINTIPGPFSVSTACYPDKWLNHKTWLPCQGESLSTLHLL